VMTLRAGRGPQVSEAQYRERALKLYPWICGRCGREFTSRNVRELTVHHKDHNHDNNPADGSNWELLCLYCHDNEHAKYHEQHVYGSSVTPREKDPEPARHNPFAGLKGLLDKQ
jgi:hypothetical protein